MTKIAIDCRSLQDDSLTRGIGSYLLNILIDIKQKDRFFLLFRDKKTIPDYPVLNEYEKIIYKPTLLFWDLKNHFKKFLLKNRVNLLFFPGQYNVFTINFPYVVTVHDIMYFPLRLQEIANSTGLKKLNYILDIKWMTHKVHKQLDKARALVAVSEYTKKDIVSFLKIDPQKIQVIYNGWDKAFQGKQASGTITKQYHLTKPYVLTVAPFETRKNVLNMISAFQNCNRDKEYQFVIITKTNPPVPEDIKTMIKNDTDIILLKNLPKTALVELYQHAVCLFFATNYEGFGLPILEAMAAGIPVITSSITSMPEVGGSAALYVDPKNTDEMADALGKLLTDKSLQQKMIKAGYENIKNFSYENCARETEELLIGILPDKNHG
ncbi:MAG: glycosyltransferase family 1 protein [Candidatus Margulisbacteria bacterium]|nr:glycosyltransferase family 1 protein [Candidatus Margulisiibacteriota bacterium]